MKAQKFLLIAALTLALGWFARGYAQPDLPAVAPTVVPTVVPGGPAAPALPTTIPTTIVATLDIVKPKLQLRLTVENRGTTSARVLRLRPGWFEYNGGSLHDWQIQIEGPGGHYQFPFFTGLVPVPSEKDFIELAPGEAFSTVIRASEAARHDNGKAYRLSDTKGTYKATVSRGTLRSNTLQFSVGE